MRDNFAVFILTHGRANIVSTMKQLEYGHYSGRWYMILDNEDDQKEQYEKNFGKEHVIVFDKRAAYQRADTMDNFNDRRAIIYARNESWRIAKELGLDYFLMLDDDYRELSWRWENDGHLMTRKIKYLDPVFESMLDMLDSTGAATVCFAQGGDFVGGVNGGRFKKGLIRKGMNSFFCRTDRPLEFRGTKNEDVVTYTTLGSRGELFLSVTRVCVVQEATQSKKGGMSAAYKEGGTYLKSFYAVMSMPSAVQVAVMYTSHFRIHHRISWENCVPLILNEKWRKERAQ